MAKGSFLAFVFWKPPCSNRPTCSRWASTFGGYGPSGSDLPISRAELDLRQRRTGCAFLCASGRLNTGEDNLPDLVTIGCTWETGRLTGACAPEAVRRENGPHSAIGAPARP